MFFKKDHYFNLANIITYINLICGIIAIDFIIHGDYNSAIILAWISGMLDILDGKIAKKFNISSDFGVQLDSFVDFISFVIMPSMFIFYVIYVNIFFQEMILAVALIIYIICGLQRLISFNLNRKEEEGSNNKFFTGVPTPLGAILLWVLYLLYTFQILENIYLISSLIIAIGLSFHSKLKIPHP